MSTTANETVMVHGKFDVMDHKSIKFLEEASKLGDLYVCVENGPNEKERFYMVESIKYVHDVRISNDLKSSLNEIKPSIFYIEQHDEEKKQIVTSMDIQYVVHSHVIDFDEKEQMSEMKKLKSDNMKLRKLCKALNGMNNSLKIEMNKSVKALTVQNIKSQKELINAFGVIATLKQMIDENDQNQNNDIDEQEEEETESGNVCVLCYSEVAFADLIKLEECEHTFCAQCAFNSISADISMYERAPICTMCDAEGKEVKIPEDICKNVIQKYDDEDESVLAQYQNILIAK